MAHLGLFVAALLDGQRLKEPFPHPLPVELCLVGAGNIALHRQIAHLAVPVQQGRAVGRVINQEVFIGQTAAKMSAQQR